MYVPSPVIVATGGIGNWSSGGIAWDVVARSQYVSAWGDGLRREATPRAPRATRTARWTRTRPTAVAATATRTARRIGRRMTGPSWRSTRP